MKISRIKLNSYLHFQPALDIDLTYPLGHERAGEPLDKVCILGQSATGKTTLLNLIKCCVCGEGHYNSTGIDKSAFVKDGVELVYKLDGKHYSKLSMGDLNFEHYDRSDYHNPKRIDYVKPFEETIDYMLEQCSPLLIHFPFCVVLPERLTEVGERLNLNPATGSLEPTTLEKRRVWDFDHATISAVWNIVFKRVESYLKEHKNSQVHSFKLIQFKPEAAANIVEDFKAWEKSNPNPIQELADKCLTKILSHFHLKIETNLLEYGNAASDPGRMHVIIKRKSDDCEVPYDFLSTGTKQVMLTAIPLFYLKPKNSIILFDQPEASLYPNIQSMLPDIYLDAAPNANQFFFATHSPVVASAFEPWEVVELRFDANGRIHRREYFTGTSRHVDNYIIRPKLLRWDASYRILFDLPIEGNAERTIKLMELASLGKAIQTNTNTVEKSALFVKYELLAKQLAWQVE